MTKIELGKRYRTRDGREVRIYADDVANPFYTVHGAVRLGDGTWSTECWSSRGAYTEVCKHGLDLIEVKPRIKREVWVNVYPTHVSVTYDTKAEADVWAKGANRIACVKLTIDCEEGEGL